MGLLYVKKNNELHFNGIVFDDFTASDGEEMWSQVCQSCVDLHNISDTVLDNAGSGICGVKGCNKESDYYIDFQ